MSFHVEGPSRMRIDMFYCENDSDSVSVLVAAQACAWVLAWHMRGISWLVHGFVHGVACAIFGILESCRARKAFYFPVEVNRIIMRISHCLSCSTTACAPCGS